MSDRTEALLYAAARAQHVDEVIRPAVEAGQVVLCDRYVDSSIVYQGTARGLGERAVADLNAWATGELRPDVTVLLDVDPEEGLRRAVGGEEPDRLEAAGLEFHRTVAEAYRRRAELEPDRYLVLDASGAVEHLHHTLRDAVLAQLADHRSDLEAADAAAAAEGDTHRTEVDGDAGAHAAADGVADVSQPDRTLELPAAETAAAPPDGEGRR